MPGIPSPKIDSGRLLLSASIAVSTQAMAGAALADHADYFTALGGALAGSNGFASSPKIQDNIRQHPEWQWLPGYKWESLSKHPYTTAGRAWEALSGEVGPMASVFVLHYLSKRVGIHYQALTDDNGEKVADYAWRLGEAVGDMWTSNSATELLWRLFATNIDMVHSPNFANSSRMGKNLFWLMKRSLAYAPMLSKAIPEAMRQHVLHSIGFAGVAFETPALNEHFALTFISSSSADDPGRPKSAYMDLDFVTRDNPFADPEGRFEEALVALDSTSREHNITRVRFYPSVLGDHRKGGKLALFVRPYFNHQPGPLIRFPASFGSSHDRTWWTDAVDRGILQGVYNEDQYTVVKYLNEFLNYKKHLITPVSDRVLEKLPALLKWAAEQPTANDYGFNFEQQMHTAAEPDVVAVDDGVNMGLPGRPKQSTHHTAINAGDDGFLFIDDYFSQRIELPILTMVTRNRYGDIKLDDLLKLEKHLPWRDYRGSEKIAFTMAKGQAYSWLVSRLMQARSDELKAHRDVVNPYRTLLNDPGAELLDLFRTCQKELVGDRSLDEAIQEQQALVDKQHKTDHQNYLANKKEWDNALKAGESLKINQDVESAALQEAQNEKDLAQQAYDEAYNKLPPKSQNRVDELKTLTTAMKADDARSARKATKQFNDLTGNKKLGLLDFSKHLQALNEKEAVLTARKTELEVIKADLADNAKTVAEKKQATDNVTSANDALAKLVELQILRDFATASKDSQSPEAVQRKVDELKQHAQTLKLPTSPESGIVGSVKEFFGTIYHALPIPKKKPATPPEITPPKPDSAEPPKPDNAEPPKPDSAEPPKPDNAEPPKPDNAEPPKPDNAEPPKPDNAEPPKPDNAEPPKPDNAEPPKPDAEPDGKNSDDDSDNKKGKRKPKTKKHKK